MKKLLSLTLATLLVFALFSGCGETENTKNDRLSVVTTIFPEYDWVKNILGEKADNIDVTLLLDNGVDLHSYQPTAEDIIKIASCDLFIYVGGESDKWVDDALKEAKNPDMIKINLLDVLGNGKKVEEEVEGMQEEHDHGDEEHETEYDEHVWLSLKNTSVFVKAISDALSKLDKDNAEIYKNNSDLYLKKLSALDKEYEECIKNSNCKTLIFADRFPFRYLTEDYGLDYFAAFSGCSAESEADFETITFLASKTDELGAPAVITLEGSDGKIANSVINATKEKSAMTVTFDSMQSTTVNDINFGADYLSVMKKNLDALKIATQKITVHSAP